MSAKKKTQDTSETTAIKTPRKRATKKAIEAEVETLTNNDSVARNEVIEAIEIKEVNEVTNDKLVEVANIPASVNVESTPLANLDTIETTTDNNQTDATDSASQDLEGSENKKKKKKKGKHNDGRMGKQDIDVQKEFYDRIINEELEVTIHVQLGKLKIEGVIIYEDQYSILIKSRFGEQMLYKQGISFISFKKPFRRPFIRRDRPFFNNRENTDNQSINDNDQVRQDSSNNQPTFDKAQTQRPTINKPETTQQTSQQTTQQSSEQPMRRPNEPKPLGRYQNQPPKNQPSKNQSPKNQSPKNQPQKDAREVKVYKIVCAPPVKPKK